MLAALSAESKFATIQISEVRIRYVVSRDNEKQKKTYKHFFSLLSYRKQFKQMKIHNSTPELDINKYAVCYEQVNLAWDHFL